ncbi:CPBP family intramembrane metalloprotease [Candidatus Micrarchaeota archaeon]|nr:CPBP family intramembrane metalloprotease [Candidatus Micrarchaeota archaeon]
MKSFFLFLFLFSILVFALSLFAPEDLILYISAAAIHVGLLSISLYFLWKSDLGTTLSSIGFPGKLKTTFIFSVLGLLSIFAILFIIGIMSIVLGFNDQQKITEKVADLPVSILLFAVIAAPVSEEFFFRAFLVKKISSIINPWAGILISSILFGLVHFSYGSIMEIVGAFTIGTILAVIFHKSKSITPCLAIHIFYNLLAIIVMRFLA